MIVTVNPINVAERVVDVNPIRILMINFVSRIPGGNALSFVFRKQL